MGILQNGFGITAYAYLPISTCIIPTITLTQNSIWKCHDVYVFSFLPLLSGFERPITYHHTNCNTRTQSFSLCSECHQLTARLVRCCINTRRLTSSVKMGWPTLPSVVLYVTLYFFLRFMQSRLGLVKIISYMNEYELPLPYSICMHLLWLWLADWPWVKLWYKETSFRLMLIAYDKPRHWKPALHN